MISEKNENGARFPVEKLITNGGKEGGGLGETAHIIVKPIHSLGFGRNLKLIILPSLYIIYGNRNLD